MSITGIMVCSGMKAVRLHGCEHSTWGADTQEKTRAHLEHVTGYGGLLPRVLHGEGSNSIVLPQLRSLRQQLLYLRWLLAPLQFPLPFITISALSQRNDPPQKTPHLVLYSKPKT